MATAGTDSGVDTGNESNDLDDIAINVNLINEMGDAVALEDCPHSLSFESGLNNFPNQSPSSGDDKECPPPPPPPTSPNICGTGSDLFPDDGDGIEGHEFPSDSLDGMQGDPTEDCEFEEDDNGEGEMDDMAMDRDLNEDEPPETSSGHGSYTPSPPFMNEFTPSAVNSEEMYLDNDNRDSGTKRRKECIPLEFESRKEKCFSIRDNMFNRQVAQPLTFSCDMPRYQNPACMTLPAFHSINSPPPAPPVTPTSSNSCRALVKASSNFEFPELPKVICDFPEPPAGLQSYLNVGPFNSSNRANTNSGGYSVLTPAPSTNDCRSLIPYEQHDLTQKFRMHTRTCRNKLYDNWSNLRREYNERRLRTATSTGNTLMVRKLLDIGVDPNASDDVGRSPLHIAACKGYSDIVRVLLQHGANPNQKDSVGNTPLHLSACTNHFDISTDLIRAGTDVSTLDNNGRNPLQLAQSKLKLMMQCAKSDNDDAIRVKKEVQQIIEMMTEYLQKKGQDLEAELLCEFANRLTLSQTPQEVDDLITDLSSLSVTSTNTLGRSRAMTNPVKAPPRNPYLIHHLNPNLARPRSASFSATTSQILPSTSNSPSPTRNFIQPGKLSRRSPTVHEEQQILMSQYNND